MTPEEYADACLVAGGLVTYSEVWLHSARLAEYLCKPGFLPVSQYVDAPLFENEAGSFYDRLYGLIHVVIVRGQL